MELTGNYRKDRHTLKAIIYLLPGTTVAQYIEFKKQQLEKGE